MKLTQHLLVLFILLTGCSESSAINEVIEPPVKNLAQTNKVNEQYISPTFIGSNVSQQKKILAQLTSLPTLSEAQVRQKLLILLALFSSDENQSLSKLQAITKQLAEFSDKKPNDYEVMAAYGNALSYQAIFYQNNYGQMNFVSRRGMRLMDRAVKQAPTNLGARLLRGVSYANMPSFLNRSSFAVTDLSIIKEQSKSEPTSEFLAFVNYYLAMALAKNNQPEQAKVLWKSLKNNTSTVWQARSIARLKEAE